MIDQDLHALREGNRQAHEPVGRVVDVFEEFLIPSEKRQQQPPPRVSIYPLPRPHAGEKSEGGGSELVGEKLTAIFRSWSCR